MDTHFDFAAYQAAKNAAEKQAFISTLAHNPPISCEFSLGDTVIVRNGYGFILDKGLKIIGFRKQPDEYGNFIYLDWDCYWVSIPLERVWKENSQQDFTAFVYSTSMPLPDLRKTDFVSFDQNFQSEVERDFIAASTVIFSWNKAWAIQNVMSQLYFKQRELASDEPDYYLENGSFRPDSTVVITSEDLDKFTEIALFNDFIPLARAEIKKGNTLYYRAF